MSNFSRNIGVVPPEQQAIKDRCFHPTGQFIEFKTEDLEGSVPDRFERQVSLHPNRLALKTSDHELTYESLNKAANRVARAILAWRGDHNESVALLFDHGAAQIIAVLAVLKAGKFYVSLDPSYPQARTRHMLEDSQAGIIVTDNQNLPLARELALQNYNLLNIEDVDSTVSSENLGLRIPPESLAFIIYTSGSTGQPKGVIHSQRSTLHMTMNFTNVFHICVEDRVSALTSLSFIAGIRDVFVALLSGAALFPFDMKKESVSHLSRWLMQEEITVCRPVLMTFRQLGSVLTGKEEFPHLRLVHVGGEPAYRHDVELYQALFPQNCIFASRLGGSETSTTRIYFIDKDSRITTNVVPIGYPLEGLQVLLLDEDGQEVGAGEVGEMAIRSSYLSPGYWRMPELTSSVFLPDPDGGDERTYLTGDLARIRPDGTLEHLGRKDFQVKVRGYRIQVSEIETVLLALDAVEEAAVVAQQYGSNDPRLVAYVVPSTMNHPMVGDLRQAVARTLPDYMVPSSFVILESLPQTPGGKLDRRALPDRDQSRPDLHDPFVRPRNPIERDLCGIWVEVLELDEVGIHDDFLELGGNSLLAGLIVSRVIQTFRIDLEIRTLLEASTVARMAVAVVQRQANQANQGNVERVLAELEVLSEGQVEGLLGGDNLPV